MNSVKLKVINYRLKDRLDKMQYKGNENYSGIPSIHFRKSGTRMRLTTTS
ncbi:hypothetical protein GGD38_000349 [Chitinophagaceae bacterium OAS944]|nr:hypothetical protein [Chitinophagaceae bacterium OAS944]